MTATIRHNVFGIALAFFCHNSASQVVPILQENGYYYASLLGCHFPLPNRYELLSTKESLLFVESDLIVGERDRMKSALGRIERLEYFDSEKLKLDSGYTPIKSEENIQVFKFEKLGSSYFGISRGSELIIVNDDKIGQEQVTMMMEFCARNPL